MSLSGQLNLFSPQHLLGAFLISLCVQTRNLGRLLIAESFNLRTNTEMKLLHVHHKGKQNNVRKLEEKLKVTLVTR